MARCNANAPAGAHRGRQASARSAGKNACNPRAELELGSQSNSLAPPIVQEVLRLPGQPLDPEVRAFFEPRFGHDFSHVRVHTDAKAAESTRAVNALAYTVGRDVVFGAGHYEPLACAGRKLLAHELTHVVQQSAAGTSDISILRVEPDHESEAEAEKATRHAFLGEEVSIELGQQATTVLARQQRQAAPDEPIERSQELHLFHGLHGAAEREFEAKPKCVKRFDVRKGNLSLCSRSFGTVPGPVCV